MLPNFAKDWQTDYRCSSDGRGFMAFGLSRRDPKANWFGLALAP